MGTDEYVTVRMRASDLTDDNADMEAVRGFNLINTTNSFVTSVFPEFTKLVKHATADDTIQFVI